MDHSIWFFNPSSEAVSFWWAITKAAPGVCPAMTDLTLLFLEGWRRLGNLRQEKWLNAVSRVYWAVLVGTWKTVPGATETVEAHWKSLVGNTTLATGWKTIFMVFWQRIWLFFAPVWRICLKLNIKVMDWILWLRRVQDSQSLTVTWLQVIIWLQVYNNNNKEQMRWKEIQNVQFTEKGRCCNRSL